MLVQSCVSCENKMLRVSHWFYHPLVWLHWSLSPCADTADGHKRVSFLFFTCHSTETRPIWRWASLVNRWKNSRGYIKSSRGLRLLLRKLKWSSARMPRSYREICEEEIASRCYRIEIRTIDPFPITSTFPVYVYIHSVAIYLWRTEICESNINFKG